MAKIREELLDELLKDYRNPTDLLGQEGILDPLKKRLMEKAMEVEMDAHLGYQKHQRKGDNSRNGYGAKKVKTGTGEIDLEVPSGPYEYL